VSKETGNFSSPLTHGELVAMVTAMLQLLWPIKQIAIINTSIQKGSAGAASIFALLDEQEEVNAGKRQYRSFGATLRRRGKTSIVTFILKA